MPAHAPIYSRPGFAVVHRWRWRWRKPLYDIDHAATDMVLYQIGPFMWFRNVGQP